MMIVNIDVVFFIAQNSNVKETSNDLSIMFYYNILPELEKEYKSLNLKPSYELKLRRTDPNKYNASIELPYGEIGKWELYEEYKTEKHKLASLDTKSLQDNIIVKIGSLPIPLSNSRYRKFAEDVENFIKLETQAKKNEKKKRLEEEHRKEEELREQQEKFVQIMSKIETIWDMIQHPKEPSESERDACCSVLSVAYENLYAMYELYENIMPQTTMSKENHFILIQHFIHFLRVMQFNIIKSEQDMISVLNTLTPLFRNNKISDTLNISNGLNFADFLGAFVKIAELTYQDKTMPFSKHLDVLREDLIKVKKEEFFKNPQVQRLLSEDIIGIVKLKYSLINGIFSIKFGKPLVKDKNPQLQYLEVPKEDIKAIFSATDFFDKGGLNATTLEKYVTESVAMPGSNVLLFELILIILKIAENYDFKEAKVFEKNAGYPQKLNYIFDRLEYVYGTLQTEYMNEITSMNKIEEYKPKYLCPQEENTTNEEEQEALQSAKINANFDS